MGIRGVGLAKRVLMPMMLRLGYDPRNWLRICQIESWKDFLKRNAPINDILEVSPGWNSAWSRADAASYTPVQYPDFDISKDRLDRKFQIVIADQVLEHVLDAPAAMANIHAMVEPSGFAMIATPFLFRVHGRPHDYHRWTEGALRHLLVKAGFADGDIETHSWGNKACAKAHIGGPVRDYGFGKDMANDPEYPMMVWAFARKL